MASDVTHDYFIDRKEEKTILFSALFASFPSTRIYCCIREDHLWHNLILPGYYSCQAMLVQYPYTKGNLIFLIGSDLLVYVAYRDMQM